MTQEVSPARRDELVRELWENYGEDVWDPKTFDAQFTPKPGALQKKPEVQPSRRMAYQNGAWLIDIPITLTARVG